MLANISLDRLPHDCGSLLKSMSPEDLCRVVQSLQQEEFPGVFDPQTQIRIAEGSTWAHFAPSWHFNPSRPLLTAELIQLIRNGGTLLSVGAGAAYTEQLLVRRFGVGQDNVTLADRSVTELPKGFRSVSFDMFGEWPVFDREFSAAIFPESVMLALRFPGSPKFIDGKLLHQERVQGLVQLVAEALKVVGNGGSIRVGSALVIQDERDAVLDQCRLIREVDKVEFREDLLLATKVT